MATEHPGHMSGRTVRLNKYIADSGRCSRREADALIEAGRVLVDGRTATLGQRVAPEQTVTLDGEPIVPLDEPVYLVLHKPVGITCTTDRRRRDNIIDYIGYPQRIFPVGRLDRDSEGLILLTNDGSIVNKILRGQNRHEKEYRVTVDKPLTPEFLRQMAQGVAILDTVTKPAKVVQEKPRVFRITLTQGLNRQIRRMCEALGYGVARLVRIRIMHINLNALPYGQYRLLTHHEVAELRRLTARSSGEPEAAGRAPDGSRIPDGGWADGSRAPDGGWADGSRAPDGGWADGNWADDSADGLMYDEE